MLSPLVWTLLIHPELRSATSAQMICDFSRSMMTGRLTVVSLARSILSRTVRASKTSPDWGLSLGIQPAKHSGRSQYGCWVNEFRHITT